MQLIMIYYNGKACFIFTNINKILFGVSNHLLVLVTEKKEQVQISYLISPHHSQSSSSAGIIYSLISVCEASHWGWFGSEKMLRLGNVIMVQNIDNQEAVVYHLLWWQYRNKFWVRLWLLITRSLLLKWQKELARL